MSKCKKNKPCKGAMELHTLWDPFAIGLIAVTTINTKTGLKGVRIAYRFTRSQKHKGVLYLNYCPWCGVDQRFKTKRKTATKK